MRARSRLAGVAGAVRCCWRRFALKGVLIRRRRAGARRRRRVRHRTRASPGLRASSATSGRIRSTAPADDAVRDRLIAELSAIGLQPDVHDAMDCSASPRRASSAARGFAM